MRCLLSLAFLAGSLLAEENGLWVYRLEPLGGMRGSTVELNFVGEDLAGATGAWFDSPDLEWVETLEACKDHVRGKVRISAGAALGPHLVHLRTPQGRTNTRLFNVTQFAPTSEVEPNDPPSNPQAIEGKSQIVYGALKDRKDIDVYRFTARAGERWIFDLRSLEYGSHLECDMTLFDEQGREVAFNDDRDDYLETPFLEHVFSRGGAYLLKIDQYRGPQQVNCDRNCGYMLQISQLPVVRAADPLGLRIGASTRIGLVGTGLESARKVWLTPVRAGEYYRLTFPFTIPLRVGPDPPPSRLEGKISKRTPGRLDLEFRVPADAPAGLWRLWIESPAGIAEGLNFDVGVAPEFDESSFTAAGSGELVINGRLDKPDEEDSYWIEVEAGKPIHAWTLATQLGLPYIDTVLELFDESGKLLAEHDDLMTGQGTVIGNPDSSLYYTPKSSGRLRLVVRDRTGRGGPTFAYRLKFDNTTPGFRLLTEPEEFRAVRGKESELAVLLIPDPGFQEAVDVRIEGVQAGPAKFPPDQEFGPSGDNDNILIPEIHVKLKAPEKPGAYPIRVVGRRASGGPEVEAFTTLWIGPPRKRNDVRRPLPAVTVTVVDDVSQNVHPDAANEPSRKPR